MQWQHTVPWPCCWPFSCKFAAPGAIAHGMHRKDISYRTGSSSTHSSSPSLPRCRGPLATTLSLCWRLACSRLNHLRSVMRPHWTPSASTDKVADLTELWS